MEYSLLDVTLDEKAAIYQIKKASIKQYVEAIWGWDEAFQLNDFNKGFILKNFRKIDVMGQIVGFLEVLEEINYISLCEIHIVDKFRCKGIGSLIIKQLMAYADRQNKKLTLGCFKANILAQKFYIRQGFKPAGETETHLLFEYINAKEL